jgi:regulation of enolase protein 1 (concanavalin A-like superfamily)
VIEVPELHALPMPLRWLHEPASWRVADDGTVEIAAGPRTDWFVDPQGEADPVVNAPALVGEQRGGDFLLSARVDVEFAETYDAGVLVLYGHDQAWAKLCLEYSPQGQPMVVSVVTRGASDDCNSFVVDGRQLWLRIARLGAAFAFHASRDGMSWQFVRNFALEPADALVVGFQAQSPLGTGCTVRFTEIRFSPGRLGDLRSGV